MGKRRNNDNANQVELSLGIVPAVLPPRDRRGPAAPAAVVAKPVPPVQAPLPTLVTPWVRVPQPNGEMLLKPGKPVVIEDEIGTREAAKILGLAQRTIEGYCDSGVLQEGIDWWQLPPKPGSNKGGNIRIKRASVMKLRGI